MPKMVIFCATWQPCLLLLQGTGGGLLPLNCNGGGRGGGHYHICIIPFSALMELGQKGNILVHSPFCQYTFSSAPVITRTLYPNRKK